MLACLSVPLARFNELPVDREVADRAGGLRRPWAFARPTHWSAPQRSNTACRSLPATSATSPRCRHCASGGLV